MLVLSRKQNEQVLIGENISLRVLRIRGNEVKIALEAPRQVPIYREERRPERNHGRSAEAAPAAEHRAEIGSASIPAVPADGALLAATLRSLAMQAHRVSCQVASGHASGVLPRLRNLLEQIARLKGILRERGQDNVLLRWLDSVERRLEAVQHQPPLRQRTRRRVLS